MLKKGPGSRRPAGLSIAHPEAESYRVNINEVTGSGTFEKGDFAIGKQGLRPANSGANNAEDSTPGVSQSGGSLSGMFSIDKLELLDIIGAGNSAICRKAVHKETQQVVALKIMSMADAAKRSQLMKELRALVTSFPAIPQFVTLFDAFFYDGNVHVVLEYMDSGSIESLLKLRGTIPEKFVQYMCKELMTGLHHLHKDRQTIHRDIKPGNALVHSNGAVKLSDFGIARALDNTLGMADSFVGTATYMSPERVQGKQYNSSCDIWSVGVMALECVSGRYPYAREGGYFALMNQIINDPAPIPTNLSLSLEFCDFVNQCLVKDPMMRPPAWRFLEAHPFLVYCTATKEDFAAWLATGAETT